MKCKLEKNKQITNKQINKYIYILIYNNDPLIINWL